MSRLGAVALVSCALGSGLASAQTVAATVERSETVPAVVACRAATAAFRDQLRFRPMAVQNESNRNAFVSCGFEHTVPGAVTDGSVGLIFRNDSGSPKTVQCTYVTTGTMVSGPYWGHSITLPAHSAGVEKVLTTAHADYPKQVRAVSCALPPGTGISALWRVYPENIGQ